MVVMGEFKMTIEQLRKVVHGQPFEAFTMHLADGREIHVRHPDFIAMSPSGRTCTVYQADDAAEYVDILMITSLRLLSGAGASTDSRN
jgi:hypothetical protein